MMNKKRCSSMILLLCGLTLWTVPKVYASTDVEQISTSHPKLIKVNYNQALINVGESDTGDIQVGQEASKQSDPIKIDADHMGYDGQTGNVAATGNVIIVNGENTIKTQKVVGNVDKEEYQIPGKLNLIGPATNLEAKDLQYNGKNQTATLKDIIGKINGKYTKSPQMNYSVKNEKPIIVLKDAMLTTEHAMAWTVAPDYRMEGETVTIIPKEKMVVKNAKFYINNWHFMTLGKYTTSLVPTEGKKMSPFKLIPKPTYRAGRGFGLRGEITYPLTNRSYLFYEYAWYSKVGYKPHYGYAYNGKIIDVELAYAKEESTVNNNHDWIEKKPELNIWLRKISVFKLPVKLHIDGNIGRWEEGSIKGDHKQFNVKVTHTPIKIGGRTKLSGEAGFQKDYYSYNDSIREMPYWNLGVSYKLNHNIWLNARYFENYSRGKSPYNWDTYEFNKHLDWGVYYKIDRLNAIGIYWKEDMVNHHLSYQDIVYYRDMHSFTGTFTYRTKQKEFKFMILAKDF